MLCYAGINYANFAFDISALSKHNKQIDSETSSQLSIRNETENNSNNNRRRNESEMNEESPIIIKTKESSNESIMTQIEEEPGSKFYFSSYSNTWLSLFGVSFKFS